MSALSLKRRLKVGGCLASILLLVLALAGTYGCTRRAKVAAAPPLTISDKQMRPILYRQELRQVLIYYATPDGRYLVPVTVSINPTREVAKTAVEKLLAGPAQDGLARTIPEGTKLREVYSVAGENIAYVDLTKELLQLKTPYEAELALRSLVLTLTELEGIENIRILVEGQRVEQLGGLKVEDTLKRPSSVNSLVKEEGKKGDTVQVYFSDKNALYLIPVAVPIPPGKEKERERVAMEALIKGPPPDSGLLPTVWPGTKLLNFFIQDGVAWVDLSREALSYGGGSTAETMFVNSLLFTLTEDFSVTKVQLLFEGKKRDHLPEGTPVNRPLSRPEHLNVIYK
ncbi:germination protein M [Thermanaeromonas toyohensis ToBE]|uniref:Germination protein M n=1 Tax=Thermanaeromonas toyohensis ToBE TaxID=698762 RepID=A0A1W1W3H2_9FIRM|nr:GerMN domain-containing protein [Thermanaeromonas toyohensis]SMC00172.1 germination protein M [Thermanaeromonas toyohensis ToBE]